VSFEPSNELTNVTEDLIVEMKSCALDFDEFLHWFLITVHINQDKVLRVFWAASEKVMDQGRVFAHFDLGLLLNLFYRFCDELPIRYHVLDQTVHWGYVFVNHSIQALISLIVLVAHDSVDWSRC